MHGEGYGGQVEGYAGYRGTVFVNAARGKCNLTEFQYVIENGKWNVIIK